MAVQKPKFNLRMLLAIAAILGLVAAACGNSTKTGSSTTTKASSGENVTITGVPGVTDTQIKYTVVGTGSNNPLGTCVLDCYLNGVKAYFDYRNDAGGIYGRDLVVSKTIDDELGKNQEAALEVTAANDTFGTFEAVQIANGWATLAAAGVPTYVWDINPAQATGHPEIFGSREVVCIECTSRPVALVVKLAGAKKIATLGYGVSDNSKQCAQAQADTIKKYSSDIGGAQVAYVNSGLDFGLPNGIAPEVTAMKQAGVDLVMGCLDLNGMKTLAQEMKRQGMGDVTIYHTNTYDQAFVTAAGDLFNNDYVQVSFRPLESNTGASSLDTYKEWMKKSGKEIDELSMNGWINADLAYQGLVAAGPDFNRQKVIDATNKMTAYTADGLTQPDWTRQHVAPTQADPTTNGAAQDCIALVKVVDGKFQIVGDASKPWDCWPGTTRDWSEPVATNFQ
jgi:ABC-type branched-subunit amino acid transport system substrate-binding protein